MDSKVLIDDMLPTCKGCYQKVKIPINESNFKMKSESQKQDYDHLQLLYSLTFCRKCKICAHLVCLGYQTPRDPKKRQADDDTEDSLFELIEVPLRDQMIKFLVYENCESCQYEY